MKKNIVVCCEAMQERIETHMVQGVWPNEPAVPALQQSGGGLIEITHCPWCGKELPFDYDLPEDAE